MSGKAKRGSRHEKEAALRSFGAVFCVRMSNGLRGAAFHARNTGRSSLRPNRGRERRQWQALRQPLRWAPVEAPGLGTAYLYTFVDVYEGKTQGFLYLYGDEAYLAYTGELALQPCGACVLPQGSWSIRFQSGRPVLMLNGSDKAKIEGVKIRQFPVFHSTLWTSTGTLWRARCSTCKP